MAEPSVTLIRVTEVMEHIKPRLVHALVEAHKALAEKPDASQEAIWTEFIKQVGNHCSTWERIPNRTVSHSH